MTDPRLTNATRVYVELKERIKAAFDLEDDDQTLADTLEGETDLNDMLAKIMREAVRMESFGDAIAALMKENADRKSRLEQKAFRLRQAVLWSMQEAGLKKLPLPDMTVSVSDGRAPLQIQDDTRVPDEFCRVKREPDRTKIRAAIEAGQDFDWCYLGNKVPAIVVRKK